MRRQGLYYAVFVEQRHIALFRDWSAKLRFVVQCSGAVCTGFTSLGWREANHSQTDDLEGVSQQQPPLCYLQACGWTTFMLLFILKKYHSFRISNKSDLPSAFFWMWFKRQWGNREAYGNVVTCYLWASALQCLCSICSQIFLFFFFNVETCQLEMWPEPIDQ